MSSELKASRMAGTDGKTQKITITLSPEASRYFAFVRYGFTKDGSTPANQSECVNEILETMEMFECETDNCMRNWLNDVAVLTGAAKEFAINPTQENLKKLISEQKTEVCDASKADSTPTDGSIK
jgi:tRNA(His) 5'-end guanylyltransferase